MRFIHNTLAAAATCLLATAPLAAQSTPTLTMEDSAECMVATIPFMMQAMVFNPDAEEQIIGAAEFWAIKADSFGEASDSHMAGVEAETEAMLAAFEAVETEEDMKAFVAPYQAKYDACEELRKALQAG